jgi:hypothetical protein
MERDQSRKRPSFHHRDIVFVDICLVALLAQYLHTNTYRATDLFVELATLIVGP